MSEKNSSKKEPKIAIVHDWLTNFRGGERVLLALKEAFPNADIYTSVYNPEKLPEFDKYKDEIRTTWLQKFPKKLRNFHQLFPVLRVFAFRSLNLRSYDIIISDTSSDAKQVKKLKPGACHICYCFTPTRYYWSHYSEYKQDPGLGKLNLIIRPIIPPFVWLMKKLDYSAAQKVNEFVAISTETQKRIKKYYERDCKVIFPPADVDGVKFNGSPPKPHPSDKSLPSQGRGYGRSGYVLLGAQVAYKRPDLAISACIKLNLDLTVIGAGPEHLKLKQLAKNHSNIKFRTDVSDVEKSELLGTFKAQIFPQEEDYGITAIECMAAGTPVIAYQKGGALDFISPESGLFFKNQTVESLSEALQKIENGEVKFKPEEVRNQALKFSKEEFITQIKSLVQNQPE
jgi:glycosyltransferase involved in cell wall biosynthesis